MRKRVLYVLMFGLPAAGASLLVASGVFGAIAGLLWVFVLGDDPWPPAVQALLGAAFVAVAIACGLVLARIAYGVGRREEAHAALNRRHAATAAGATALVAAVFVLHQWRVGNLGAPSDSVRCMDLCRAAGFDASAMPPRDQRPAPVCQCLDANGRVARETTLH